MVTGTSLIVHTPSSVGLTAFLSCLATSFRKLLSLSRPGGGTQRENNLFRIQGRHLPSLLVGKQQEGGEKKTQDFQLEIFAAFSSLRKITESFSPQEQGTWKSILRTKGAPSIKEGFQPCVRLKKNWESFKGKPQADNS